ncbi:DUF1992 domain-containing protein [Bacillaceae bacterium S4-13-56]
MDVHFSSIVEEKIKQAIRDGDFENLPGKGKPLKLDDMEGIPSDLRVGYKIMKNAGMIPEEMQIKKEMITLEELIATCKDPEQKEEYHRKLNEKQLRFQLMMEKRKLGGNSAFHQYRNRIRNRIGF